MAAYENTVIEIRNALKSVFGEIYQWYNVPTELSHYRPQDQGWTINEILEHITLTNHYLMIVLRHNYPKALKRVKGKVFIGNEESNLENLQVIGQKGSFTWVRPQHMEPTGKHSLEEIKTLMGQQEKECLDILTKLENGAGSLYKVRMSVNDTGKIDLYQWLYFLVQHAHRHIQQMLENKLEWSNNSQQNTFIK